MTAEEVNALVTKALQDNKVLSMDDLKKVLPLDKLVDKDGKSIVATLPEVQAYNNGLAGRFEQVYAELTPQMVSHHEMFKEPMDMKKVFKVMTEFAKDPQNGGRMMDPQDAYRSAYKDKFEERDKTVRAAEITAAETRGEEKARKTFQQSTGGRAIPTDSRGGLSAMGPVMKRYAARQAAPPEEGKPVSAPLGKGIISRMQTEEYLNKQNGSGAAA